MREEKLRIAGAEVQSRRGGEGPGLLFLHAGDGAGPASRLVDDLARDFEVFAPSHPGFDDSDLPPEITTVDDLAYFYLDFIECVARAPVWIVGCSLGAWIAAEIAIKNEASIAGLVLVNPIGAKFDARDERRLADVFYQSHRDARRLLYADGRRDDRDFSAIEEAEVTRFVRNWESFTLLGWSPLLHDPKLRQRLRRIRRPALVIAGEDDRIAPPDYARAFASALTHCERQTLANAGHYAHDERPDEIAHMVRTFIARENYVRKEKG